MVGKENIMYDPEDKEPKDKDQWFEDYERELDEEEDWGFWD